MYIYMLLLLHMHVATLYIGEFGVVYKGNLLKDLGQTFVGTVAVKTLKGLKQRS